MPTGAYGFGASSTDSKGYKSRYRCGKMNGRWGLWNPTFGRQSRGGGVRGGVRGGVCVSGGGCSAIQMVAGQLVSCTAHRRHGVTTNGLAECVDSYRKKEGFVGATGCKPCDAGCCVGRKLVPRHWAAVFSTGRHCRVRWTTFECVHRSVNIGVYADIHQHPFMFPFWDGGMVHHISAP